MRGICFLLFAALLVPAANANPAGPGFGVTNPTAPIQETLYFHVLEPLQDFVINPEPVDPWYYVDGATGMATNSDNCVQNGPPVATMSYHDYFGYANIGGVEYPKSNGYVQYQDLGDNNKPRVSVTRGTPYGVEITGDALTVHWYLSTAIGTADRVTEPITGSPTPVDPGASIVVPDVAVHAWMRDGSAISLYDQAYKDGALLAEGETVGTLAGPATMTSSGAGVTYSTETDPDGRTIAVYDYAVSLDVHQRIVGPNGFNVHLAVFLKNQVCDDPENKILMPNTVRVHSSPGHRPRMELSVLDPVRILYIHPQFIDQDLVIHTSSNSLWGAVDIDSNATLRIDGPTEAKGLFKAAIVQRYHEHNEHLRDQDISWVWPYKADGATDGDYKVTFTVQNKAHTANATAVVGFTLGRDLQVVRCGILDLEHADAKTQDPAHVPCEQVFMDAMGNILDGAKKASAWPILGVALVLLGAASRRRT